MASSRNNLTAVHFSLIFFVMLTIGLGAWAYVSARDLHLARTAEARAKDALEEEEKLRRQVDDQVVQLKLLLGYEADKIRDEKDPADANTLLAMMDADMVKFGGDLPQYTFSTLIPRLRLKLGAVSQARQALEADVAIVDGQTKTLSDRYNVVIDRFTAAKEAAEKQKQDLENRHQMAVQEKDKQIQTLDGEKTQVRIQLAAVKEERRIKAQEQQKEIGQLVEINTKIQEDIDKTVKVSFEKPDGVIHWVNNVDKRVWISVGESDLLPKRTNFSVWTKTHAGIGRDVADIKGAIEVTRLIDPHLAEARILHEEMQRPIMPGDPIYTPLWSPGRTEKFALVGLIDIDGDGRSDRKLLHDMIAATGSRVVTEIDDEGNRTGEPISVEIKFVIIGKIPEPVIGGIPADKKIAQKIGQEYKELLTPIRKHGIRRVPLSEFMKFIGYIPQRRLWRPGDQARFTLKAGAHSTSVSETAGDRASSGQVSRAYTARKKLGQDTSSGQTSKAHSGRARD